MIDSKANQILSQKSATENIQEQIGNDSNELEELSQDIFENLGLSEQILNDFRNGLLVPDQKLNADQLETRKRITSNLMIDTIMRRGEYGKFYQDLDSAAQDLEMVVKLCKDYPENN